jgi:hypothetical protein
VQLVVGLADDDDASRLLIQVLLNPADILQSLADHVVSDAALLQLDDNVQTFLVFAQKIDPVSYSLPLRVRPFSTTKTFSARKSRRSCSVLIEPDAFIKES